MVNWATSTLMANPWPECGGKKSGARKKRATRKKRTKRATPISAIGFKKKRTRRTKRASSRPAKGSPAAKKLMASLRARRK